MLLLPLLLLICLFTLIYLYFEWNNDYWQKRGVIGPRPQFLFGNFRASFLKQRNIVYDLLDIYTEYRGKAPYIGVFRNKIPQLLVLDPDIVKTVLISSFANFRDNEISLFVDKQNDPLVARNPFSAEGEYWKEKRSEILPAFTQTKLRAVYPVVKDICNQLQNYIKSHIESNSSALHTFEVKELGSKLTADVVSSAIYGLDAQEFQKGKSQIREMGSTIITASIVRYMNIVNVFPLVKYFYKMKLTSDTVKTFFIRLMDDAIQLRNDRQIYRDDFLNFLLELKKKKSLSHMDMAGHTLTFFLDGFETSSGAIAYILYELAKHPQTQTTLRNEVQNFIAEHGQINADNINDIQYLDQVFYESQRLHPALGLMTKICTIPFELKDYKDKKVLIEKGTPVIVPVYPIHRDPEYYPNPAEFNPERFSVQNGGIKQYKDKGVYLAFGDGPRVCLGIKFALLQVKSAIIAILEQFELSLNGKSKDGFVFDREGFLLASEDGLWVDFKPLNKL